MKVSVVRKLQVKTLVGLGNFAIFNRPLRKYLLRRMEERIHHDLIVANPDNRLLKVQEDKYVLGKALLRSIDRAFERGNISHGAARGLLSVFLGNVFFGGFYKRREFIEKYGFKPPMFMTISPTLHCNLRCKGCYANAKDAPYRKLPWDVFDRIIQEAKDLWGANFFVISGGEPLLYADKGKSFLDIAEKHDDCFFLMYTNGTLINDFMAKRLAELGNITPAISVEGLKKETDERRGEGVFEKTHEGMANLRKYGVPFGISVTLTKYNADVVVSEKFLDHYFDQEGAIYMWVFHYMPIGRDYDPDLLIPPEKRFELFKREWQIVREREIFIADFWNSGTASDGCICAARGGGYFYITWDGDVTPCVFVPFSTHNIIKVYEEGGTLETVINSKLFRRIREWQNNYAYAQPADKTGNLLRQCPMRDHYDVIFRAVKEVGAHGIDEDANSIVGDEEYRRKMVEYGEAIDRITHEYWEREYLSKG